MAERVGFEPTVPVKVQQFSRLPDSTTLAPLRAVKRIKDKGLRIKCEEDYFRRERKKSCISVAHSLARTPLVISIWWLSSGLVQSWK